tara:strand:- start:27 stop:488 length:462 start_codon:yes stop_codon:yes gene_type:complete
MNKYVSIIGIFIIVLSMNFPSFAQNNSLETKPKLINADVNELSNLLLSWELESDLLKKAELAKKIQKNLGVNSDGLVGAKTILALTNLGLSKKFTKPSKDDILNTKILLKAEISPKNETATKNKNLTKSKNVTNNKNITKSKNVSQKKKYKKK